MRPVPEPAEDRMPLTSGRAVTACRISGADRDTGTSPYLNSEYREEKVLTASPVLW